MKVRGIALLLAAALGVAACGGESVLSGASDGPGVASTTEAPSTTTTTRAGSPGSYPEDVVESYLEDCISDSGDRGYCLCTVREFEERLTLDEFLELGSGDATGGVVLEVSEICRRQSGGMVETTTTVPGVPATLEAYTEATIEALVAYWEEALPDTYGVAYQDVTAAVPYFPSEGGLPECGPDPLPAEVYANNAFYCRPGDFVAWDAEGLIPGLYTEFGDFAVALVLAHEWGHAIQARADVRGATIMTELQADCFAGAWAAHVEAGDSEVLALQPGDLDEAMAGYLLFRDPPGTSPAAPQAHGSAFDRVNAFQEGFAEGPDTCRAYEQGEFAVVSIPLTQGDLATGGDLPFDQTAPLLASTLETYWEAVFPDLFGTGYTPMTDYGPYLPSTGVLPPCGGLDAGDYEGNAFYCPDGDYVAWDDENLFPALWQQIGDFAVGMVLAHEWATGVQFRAGIPVDGLDASLQADCFTGSWTAAMVNGIPIVLEDGTETSIVLSAGDLDEAVAGFLVFGDDPGSNLASAGSAFDRFDAFQQGFFRGAGQCLAYGP